MNSYVLDTYAWVEYFRGTNLADKVEGILKEKMFYSNNCNSRASNKVFKRKLRFYPSC